jgi:predicted CXXCH cytochrome family protein
MERNSAKECAICHISWIDVFYFEGRPTGLTERPPADAAASEEMCFSCHNGSLVDSRERVWGKGGGHPVNKPPPAGFSVPRILPLGRDGRIVCATCHSAHGVPDRTRFEQIIFLRVSDKNSELCLLCHRDKAGGTHAGNHSLLKPVDEAARRRIGERGGRFSDAGGIICESCHTAHGAAAEHMLVLTDRNPDGAPGLCEECHGSNPGKGNRKEGGFSHPVGVLPSDVTMPAARESEAPGRTGRQGRILCITCHRPHKAVRDTPLLVRPYGEEFCLECHKKKSSVAGTNHDLRIIEGAGGKKAEEASSKFGPCGPCHAVHGAAGPRLFALPPPAEPDADAVSRTCLSCHREGGVARGKPVGDSLASAHPVGRPAPGGMRAEGFPLYGMDGARPGRIVSCATCHDVHRWDPANAANRPGKKTEGDASTSFLRHADTRESALCLRCHGEKELVRKTSHDAAVAPEVSRGKKASLCGACHVVHGAKGSRLWARELPVREDLDRTSAICCSCHGEGAAAPWGPERSKGHPVRKAAPKGMEAAGLPLFAPDGALRGNVLSCATCHDAHRWDPVNASNRPGKKTRGNASTSFLRIPSGRDSRLCVACHNEKETIARTAHDPGVAPKAMPGNPGTLCGGCHAVHGAKGARMWAGKPPVREGQDPVSTLCLACHGEGGAAKSKTSVSRSHTVGKGIPPGMDASGLPFSEATFGTRDKILTCATCHDVHRFDPADASNRPGNKEKGNASTDFLRKPSSGSAPLCVTCHAGQRLVAGTKHDLSVSPAERTTPPADPASGGVCSHCHRVHDAKARRLLWGRDIEKTASPDPVRPYCRSCHRKDGLAAKKSVDDPQHPVGVPWKGPALPLPLDRQADGRGNLVTCSTCHDAHGMTSPPDTGSAGGSAEGGITRLPLSGEKSLCGACHAKETAVADTPHDRRKMGELLGPAGEKELRAGPCAPCHAAHAPKNRSVLWSGPIGEGEDDMTRFCTGCHLDEKLARRKRIFLPRHPRDVYITNRAIGLKGRKADFPLFDNAGRRDASGVIACPTCHNPHQWDAADPSRKPAEGEEGSAVNDFLRNKGANFGFCGDCHSIRSILLYKNYHDPREWKKRTR